MPARSGVRATRRCRSTVQSICGPECTRKVPTVASVTSAHVSAGVPQVEKSMSVMSWIGLVLAVALGVYLVAALMRPEKFE